MGGSTDGGGQNRRCVLADFGLVSLVVGGTASLLLGIVVIGTVILLGRIPLLVGLPFVLTGLLTIFGLIVTITSVRRNSAARLGPEGDGGS